nr:hypothetical protein CFP56_36666 [Quercus suber]
MLSRIIFTLRRRRSCMSLVRCLMPNFVSMFVTTVPQGGAFDVRFGRPSGSASNSTACSAYTKLKHGALIWKESLHKNVQSQILSEPQGKRYILALGEIYRVVEVLRVSTKIHKPRLLLTSTDNAGLVGLLGECYSIWSSSGIEDAVKSISDCIDFEYDGTIKALLESIKYIHDIDALALQNHVFSGQPICHLSALSARIVPGILIS